MSLHDDMVAMGDRARTAAQALSTCSTAQKNEILLGMADALDRARDALKTANAQDLQAGREAGLTAALLDRLELTDKRIDAMIAGIGQVTKLPDPVGAVLDSITHQNGMRIDKVRVPIGVIGIVYESRPNVTADAAVLCIKAGNAVILRGGKEALHSNRAICDALLEGGRAKGLADGALHCVDQGSEHQLVVTFGHAAEPHVREVLEPFEVRDGDATGVEE